MQRTTSLKHHINPPKNWIECELMINSGEDPLVELHNSLWRSPGGSLYRCMNGKFICIHVHSHIYTGWLNKIAIKNIHLVETEWYGEQAFRNAFSGMLIRWEQIRLIITRNRIIKLFPQHISPHSLVHGYKEEYTRVYEH